MAEAAGMGDVLEVEEDEVDMVVTAGTQASPHELVASEARAAMEVSAAVARAVLVRLAGGAAPEAAEVVGRWVAIDDQIQSREPRHLEGGQTASPPGPTRCTHRLQRSNSSSRHL